MSGSRDSSPVDASVQAATAQSPHGERDWLRWEIDDFAHQVETFRVAIETAKRWGWRGLIPELDDDDPNVGPAGGPAVRPQ